MNEREILRWANEQLVKWNLEDWSVVIDTRPTARLGQCRYRTHEIGISRVAVQRQTEEGLKDTVLHEVAHALAGPLAKHGPNWKRQARRVGARAASHADAALMAVERKFKWTATCGVCGKVFGRDRLARNVRLGAHCPCQGRRTTETNLHWRQTR